MISLPFGKISEKQRLFIPESTIEKTKREGRIILAVYAFILLGAVFLQSWMPLWLWLLPRFIGEPFMRWLRIAEHAECEESADLTRNTRTTRAPIWLHALFWNMSYHSEHHLCPAVPFHILPEFHEAVGKKLYPVASGYGTVHGEVLSNLLNRRGVTWAEPQIRIG